MGDFVLLIDNNSRLVWPLRSRLQHDGHLLSHARSEDEGMELVRREGPDVVVIGLGGEQGLAVCRRIRSVSPTVLCMLTGEASPGRIAEGFAAGADMVVGMPYDVTELAARIRALLRRARSRLDDGSTDTLMLGDIELRMADRTVMRRGQLVDLSPIEFRLLTTLARNAGRVVPHQRILAEVWGPGYVSENQYLRNYIRALREKLEDDPARPAYILTDWGVGYRLAGVMQEQRPVEASV
jgi:two-component system KDP operon response regulator KdpE